MIDLIGKRRRAWSALVSLLCACSLGWSAPPQPAAQPAAQPEPPPTMAAVLEAASAADWRPLDPARTLEIELASGGRVVVELAPEFAPRHVENIVRLVRQRYFDGLPIVRVQENYVVQWGDPDSDEDTARPLGEAQPRLAAELDRPLAGLEPTALPDADAYAPRTGFAGGFPVAWEPATARIWLAHCYAMLGVGRGDAADSGSGAELYVVIGHAPRHLDRNVTLVGRVVRGMERLTTLPRGTGPLGFYEDAAQRIPLRSVRLAADLPAAERPALEALRTDTATFRALIEARRHRREPWFLHPVGHIELCNVPLPIRDAPRAAPAAQP
jgi:peptidylprolyl isomerase